MAKTIVQDNVFSECTQVSLEKNSIYISERFHLSLRKIPLVGFYVSSILFCFSYCSKWKPTVFEPLQSVCAPLIGAEDPI